MAKKYHSPVYEQFVQAQLQVCKREIQRSRTVMHDAKKLIDKAQKAIEQSRILRRS